MNLELKVAKINAGSVRPVLGKLLFKFAIITDTHIRLPEDTWLTPWKGQSEAIARARLAVQQIALARPQFVLHLGDVVQPVPHIPSHARTSKLASEIFADSGLEYHFVPGNHDVGDKCTAVSPAHAIDQYCVDQFQSLVGPSYLSFDRDGIHFVTINTSLVGSGLAQEAAQLAWLENDLNENRAKRIFLFIHYPLFMGRVDEPSYYDNVEEPGRSHILSLLEKYGVEAVFAGHVHNFFYHDHKGTELYSLLSTCFVRHDYSELFNVSPDREFGRDDQGKLGWAEVEVYDTGHILNIRRMFTPPMIGADSTPRYPDLPPPNVKRRLPTTLGVHLRSAWAELKSISLNGPIDEFVRRKVRNDYDLLGFSETGIRHLRVPLSDLLDPEYRARMETLSAAGHKFTLFHVGVPQDYNDDILGLAEALGADIEITLSWRGPAEHVEPLRAFRTRWKGRIFISSIVSASDHRRPEFKGGYVPMSFGFDISEFAILREFHQQFGAALGLGYVFRIPPPQSVLVSGLAIDGFARSLDIQTSLNIILGDENPAVMTGDDLATANRVAEAVLVGAACERVLPFLDTYTDQDRGYFPRHGIYDGRYNRRLGSYVAGNLIAYLAGGDRPVIGAPVELQGALRWEFEFNGTKNALVLPNSGLSQAEKQTLTDRLTPSDRRERILDLVTGSFVGSIPALDRPIVVVRE
jgi:3',5'-cyclic AMP phosphodiesterase CpdA